MAKKGGTGGYAFLIGFILAVLLGLVSGLASGMLGDAGWVIALVLIILGVIVGLVNIRDEHVNEFLVAVIAVTLIGFMPIQQIMSMYMPLGTVLAAILQSIVIFAVPAALVLGLRQIWVLGYPAARK